MVVLALVVAATPFVGSRWALSAHQAAQAQATIDDLAARTLAHIESTLVEATDALAAVAPAARGPCAAELRGALTAAVADATYLRNVLVLGADGRTACAAGEIPAGALADLVFRPARNAALAVAAKRAEDGRATLFVRHRQGETTLVALLSFDARRVDLLPSEWRGATIGQLVFDDGSAFSALPVGHDADSVGGRVYSAERASDGYPFKVSFSIPVEVVRENQRALTLAADAAAAFLGAVFLALCLYAVRRPRTLDEALRRGIRRNEFVPFYQPVFDIRSGALVGAEVLIRWQRRDGSMAPPGMFIQHAEESGLAVEMTRQLMRKARDEAGALYAERPDLKLAFNLFADHFSDLSTVEDVREIFKSGGIRYRQLVFEVTERYPLPNLNRARLAIAGLQDLGCRVALDDAGTGHGGLAYLQQLGMDQVKIDKLFVDTITAASVSAPILDSLVDIGNSLGMEVVAEGVETREQLAYLKARGVHHAQGFLFAKPLPGRDYLRLAAALAPPAPAPPAEPATESARAA
jgi:EAL domain-containing protein (putative c-di-GMP-specific phosphodiesterase class I)